MKNKAVIVTSLVVGVVVLFLVSVYGLGFLQRSTADFRGDTKQIEDTQANSNYRIAAYDHFYDLCGSVQSIESKIGNMEDELAEADTAERKNVLNSSITASKNKRAELIATYNADARKEATSGQFKASDLPYEINENEEATSCEAY